MLRIIDLFFFEFVTEFSSYFINIFVFVAQLARELQAEEGDDDLSPSASSTPRVVSSRAESSSAAALDAAIDDVLASAPRARSREESGISATLAAVRNSFLSTLASPLWSLALLTFLCTYILCCVPMQGLSAAEDITSGGRAGGAREGAAGSAVGETLSTDAQSGVTDEAAVIVEDDAAAERREKRERLRRLLAEQERAEVRALCC